MKVCVVTSLAASVEPRAPRHALAARQAFPDAEVIFVDMAPLGTAPVAGPPMPGVSRRTIGYPWRGKSVARLALRKVRLRLARLRFLLTGALSDELFSERTIGLARILKPVRADLYFAHNIETLLPAMHAARAHGGRVVFDSMEYHSDMGDGQTRVEKRATKALESRLLSQCALVTASSDALADALEDEYGIDRPLALYNTPPTLRDLPSTKREGFNLYWRNGTIGFGQRGLDDALVALTELPHDVHLFLQGRLSPDTRAEIEARVEGLGLAGRVTLLAPYPAGEAVPAAAPYQVGLCLERAGPLNHALTVSNKMFDYHMAGLAIVSSNMPSLAQILSRSRGGVTYSAGSPSDLARKIRFLYDRPDELAKHARSARAFALAVGNMEEDMRRLKNALVELAPKAGERVEPCAD